MGLYFPIVSSGCGREALVWVLVLGAALVVLVVWVLVRCGQHLLRKVRGINFEKMQKKDKMDWCFFTEIPSSLLPRVHYTAPVVTFSLDYFIFPTYLKYRRTKHLSRGRAWRKEPKIHSTSKLREQIMKNEELKEDLLNRLAKQRAVQAEMREEGQSNLQEQLQGQLQGQSSLESKRSQVLERQSSLEGQSSQKLERQNSQVLEGQSKLERQKEQLERQSSLEGQKGELPSLPHQRTIRRWIRVLSAGWDHLHKTVARYFDKWWNLFWYRTRSGVFDLFSLQSFLNGLSWEEKRRGSPYYYAFVRSP